MTKSKNIVHLDVYADSDWAGAADRHSQTSLHVVCDECPMMGLSRRQQVIATSSGEAEYYAMASGLSQGLLFKVVLEYFNFKVVARVLSDSSAARGIVKREGVGKIKHLSTRVLWAQQVVKLKEFLVSAVPTAENRADLGTKALAGPRLVYLRELCGLYRPGDRQGQHDRQVQQDDEQGGRVAASISCSAACASIRALMAAGLLAKAVGLESEKEENDSGVSSYHIVWSLVVIFLAAFVWEMGKESAKLVKCQLLTKEVGASSSCPTLQATSSPMTPSEFEVRRPGDRHPSSVRDRVERRSVRVQAPTRYSWNTKMPRFMPLGDGDHGAWSE